MIPLAPMLNSGRAVNPYAGLALLLGTGGAAFLGVRIYAGIKVPDIPPEELREVAAAYRELADDLAKEDDPEAGVHGAANRAAASVWKHSGGESVDAFARLYIHRIMLLPQAFARNCRVLAHACDAYAEQIEKAREHYAKINQGIMQMVWLVGFQPLTSALYGVASALAALQIARLVKLAHLVKASFGLNVARILQTPFPTYAATTLNYAVLDGLAYGGGSLGIDMMVNASHGVPNAPLSDQAEELGKIMAANTSYILGYDLAKLGMRGAPDSRQGELVARLFGSGFGYTPTAGLLDEEDKELLATEEEWLSKVSGHGLRAVIFPPGWRF